MQPVMEKQQPAVLWDRQRADCLLWWRISFTQRCNCQCSYCSAAFRHRPDVKTAQAGRVLTWQQWLIICNKLDTGLVFTGGEPFLYPDLFRVLCNVDHKLRINSNLGPLRDGDLYTLVSRGNLSFIASYHHKQPGALPQVEFARRVRILLDGGIKVKTNMVSTGPEHGRDVLNPVKRAFRRDYGITADISRDARFYDPWPGTRDDGKCRDVNCQTGCLRLVGPDGFRYPCESTLVRGVGQMEDLLKEKPKPMQYDTRCADFGLCLPCDRHGPRKIEAV